MYWPALLSIAFALVLLTAPPRIKEWLLPPKRQRAVSWGGWEVVILFFLVTWFWPALVGDSLNRTTFFEWLYGPGFGTPGRGPMDSTRRQLWQMAFAAPFQLASILLVLHRPSGTRPYQVGLTLNRMASNMVLGVACWLVLTPPLYTLLYVLDKWLARAEKHPIETLVQTERLPGEWTLVVLSTMILAPLWEEVLFRGVLQPWLTKRRWGSLVVVAGSLALAVYLRIPMMMKAWDDDGVFAVVKELGPAAFVVSLLPLYLFLRFVVRSRVAEAVFCSALLFGAAHSAVWPTPIPLFILGLMLGWLRQRTQSLVAPITLHGLINMVASLQLLLGQPAQPEPANGKADTSVERRVPAESTSSTIPGCWLPRRTYPSAITPYLGDCTHEVIYPTSSAARKSLLPGGTALDPAIFNPSSERLTWPRSRLRTTGSWPR